MTAVAGMAAPAAAQGPVTQTPGDKMVQALRANTVAIRAEWPEDEARSDGFGSITAVKGGYTYVMTANHVVRGYEGDNLAEKVTVRFFGSRKPIPAEVLEQHDPTLDVGVIRIKGTPTRPWFRSASGAYANADRGTAVWFIGRSGTWYTPARPGTVNYIDPDLGLVLEGLSVIVGTSGAPLISKDGIVGIMTTDAAGDLSRACPIKKVRKLLQTWKVPWQLVPPDLSQAPPTLKMTAAAVADAARLAQRMGNFERAGAAAKLALKKDPKSVDAAKLVIAAAARGPWRLCHMAEPNSCTSDNPYFAMADPALKTLRRDKNAQASEEVLADRARLLHMKGRLKAAGRVAETGLKSYPTSAPLLAEAGMARVRAGRADGVDLIAQARTEEPNEHLYLVYHIMAALDGGRPVEAAKVTPPAMELSKLWRQGISQTFYTKLTAILAQHVPKKMWATLYNLIPRIEADTEGKAMDYEELAQALTKHKQSSGYSQGADRLFALVALRRGKLDEARKAGKEYLKKIGGVSYQLYQTKDPIAEKRKPAFGRLKFYHQLLIALNEDAATRYFIERNLGLAFTVPHQAYPKQEPIEFAEGFDEMIFAIAMTEPATRVYSAQNDGVRQWGLPGLRAEAFVKTDSPACAVDTSDDGSIAVFATQDGRAFVWDTVRGTLRRLKGPAKVACAITIRRDGKRIASVTAKNRVVAWSTAKALKGKRAKRAFKLPWPSAELTFSDQGNKLMAAARGKNGFVIAKLSSKKVKAFACGTAAKPVLGTTVDAASGRVAVADARMVNVCEANRKDVLFSTKSRGEGTHRLRLVEGGRKLYVQAKRSSGRAYTIESTNGSGRRSSRYDFTKAINGPVSLVRLSKDMTTAVGVEVSYSRVKLEAHHRAHADSGKWKGVVRGPSKSSWTRVAVDPRGARIALASKTREKSSTLSVFEAGTGKAVCTAKKFRSNYPMFTRSGSTLVVAEEDLERPRTYGAADCEPIGPSRLEFISSSGRLAFARSGPKAQVYDLRAGTDPKSFDCELRTTEMAAFSDDDRWLVAADANGVCFVDLSTGRAERKTYRLRRPETNREIDGPRSARFTENNQAVILFDESGAIDRWDLATKARSTFSGPQGVGIHRKPTPLGIIDPGDKTIVTLTNAGDVMRWDLSTKDATQTAFVPGDHAFGFEVSADGKKLLVTQQLGKSSIVRILDRANLKPLATIRGFSDDRWIAYGPQGACWTPDKDASGLIPAFTIKGSKIKKTARRCDDARIRAAIPAAL